MKITPIVENKPINFADVCPQIKEILLDAFDAIINFENITFPIDDDDFEVYYSSDELANNFGGAFIVSPFGSYLLHDLEERQIAWYEDDPTECTVLFYSLSKIEDNVQINVI
jgi:hypothetical protein